MRAPFRHQTAGWPSAGFHRIGPLNHERLADIKADRDRARSALERIKGKSSAASIDGAKIERFGTLMRDNITTGDVPFRKAYLRWLIDAVEVDDRVIRIHGSKSTLEQAVIAGSPAGKGVRSLYANGAR